MNEQIDYGKCIDIGHKMQYVKAVYDAECHICIVKKCERCGYTSKKKATIDEPLALTKLDIEFV